MSVTISQGSILGQASITGLGTHRGPMDDELLGTFKVYKIQNGYLLRFAFLEGDIWQTTYVGTADKIGESVTSILVQRKLDDANHIK